MSYFMVTKGKIPDFAEIDKIEALPIMQAQLYLSRLANDLSEDGNISDLYFVHDGETGTSDNFVSEAEGLFFRIESFANTRFDKIIDACIKAGNSFRVWYPVSPTAHLDVKRFNNADLLKKAIADQIFNLHRTSPMIGVSVAYTPKKVSG